jgi:hypothetical protein
MGRYLKRNKGTEAPSNMIFFDTESWIRPLEGKIKGSSLSLRLWTAIRVRLEKGKITRRKVAYGYDSESFWQFVFAHSSAQRTTWIFAHNLSHDLTQVRFWHKLDDQTFTVQPIKSKSKRIDGSFVNSWQGKLCLDTHPTFMQIRSDKRKYKLVDTCNYWPKSLLLIGKGFGLEKGSLPTVVNSDQFWLEYCIRDSEVIEKAITEMAITWTKENCGVFQMTAPSLAMTNFRHTCDVLTPDNAAVDIVPTGGSKASQLEREAYFGGRFQCFYVGERYHKCYQIDCNSLYPFVMRDHNYPRRFMFYERNVDVKRTKLATDTYGMCARVFISSRHDTFPVRIDGRQYHCNGKFWTSLCGPELDRAVRTGSISSLSTVQFYSVAPIFRSWVDYWYPRKVKASRHFDNHPGDYEFAKLILNSLSGKFAQTGIRWTDRTDKIPLARWGGYVSSEDGETSYSRFRGVGGNCQQLTREGEPEHAFPLISAYITAYAREYMREVIQVASAGNVYYMATDSLIVNDDGYNKLKDEGYIHPYALGKFKVEREADYVRINGSNNYTFGEKQTLSGPASKARVDANGILRADLWDQLPNIIATGPRDDILIREIALMPPDPDNKGVIGNDGWWNPYRITDDVSFTDRPRQGGYFASDLLDTVEAHIQPI